MSKQHNQQSYIIRAIGLMSGTSLDGLDIAYCEFQVNQKKWTFNILAAETVKYPKKLSNQLANAHQVSAFEFWNLHVQFGNFCGHAVNQFIKKYNCDPVIISSHGHTIFHQPHLGITCQIGDASQIAAITGVSTVCDFRSKDVALGGQGAPLVPLGDQLLFSDFDACLNIGGITNISFKTGKELVAYDICPANIVFNYYARLLGKSYDKNGILAQKGKLSSKLLNRLNKLSFYNQSFPRSLGREWVEKQIIQRVDAYDLPIEDKLATVLEHAAMKVAAVFNQYELKKILLTGGGAYNTFFLERIRFHTEAELCVPESQIIEFKEALLFALLGVLRFQEDINCLKSVTGARFDHCGGAIYLGNHN